MARVVALIVVWAAAVSAIAQEPTFRGGTSAVPVYTTVRNRDGHLVGDLPRDAFQLLDNGQPVQISVFSNAPQRVTAALMLDMSGSMTGEFFRVREAALALVAALSSDDRVRIGTFGDEIAMSPHLTGDKDVLSRVLYNELWPGGGTPLWEAIRAGMDSLPRGLSRPVVVVLTDGKVGVGSGSSLVGQIERRARDEGFMVYAVGFKSTGLDAAVTTLADRTGGGHFEVAGGMDLPATFRGLIDELRHQYLLGFFPGVADGTTHALDVSVRDRSLKVQAREGYFSGIR